MAYNYYDAEESTITDYIPFIIGLVIVVIIIIGWLTGCKPFNSKKYYELIEVQEGVFSEDISSPLDAEIMDQGTAEHIGSRKMGEIDDVSQYKISEEYNMIIYKGETYRISPLEYASNIKAYNGKGISGYILVNCSTQEAELIKLEDKMMYTPSSVFSYDLTRHIRKSYPSALLGKEQFEIDEEGNPYYIVPTYKTTIGLYGGKILDKVLVVDAITGKIDEYTIDTLPEWVEHADSIDHLAELTQYRLRFKNGYINSFTSQKDVKNLSYNYRSKTDQSYAGYSSVKQNNSIVYFTGVTSVNNDESITGFMCLNPRNGSVKFYQCVGAEESSAMESAEALVQNFGYKASYPFIVNVNGYETYLVSLKDKTNVNKAYSFVNVKNYTISTQASTKEEALKQYINIMDKKGDNISSTSEAPEGKITGKIVNIYNVTEEGTTYFYYTLESREELFVSSILNNRNQVKLKVGDTITVEGERKSDSYLVNTIEF